MFMKEISISLLRDYFNYDPASGEIRWKKSPHHKVKAGDIAGFIEPRGYRVLQFKKTLWKGHRIALALMNNEFPNGEVDHIDGNPSNNRFENLRVVDKSQNQMNRAVSKNNRSGIKGVHFCESKQKWVSRISVGKNRIHIGGFNSFDEAIQKRKQFEDEFYGQYARR